MELPKEYREVIEFYKTGTVEDIVAKCFALASKPPRELTDAEKYAIWIDVWRGEYTNTWLESGSDVVDAIIAAYERKQSEPERVKFRAARRKSSSVVQMFSVDSVIDLGPDWEWLEPEQSFEVTLP